MTFLNALAWVFIVWFALWFVSAVYRLGVERNAHRLALTYISVQRRAGWMTGLFIVSVLWLIFG